MTVISFCAYTYGLLSFKHYHEVQEQKRGALAQDELVYRVSCKSIFEFQYSSYDICNALFCLDRHSTQFSLFNANNRQTDEKKEMLPFLQARVFCRNSVLAFRRVLYIKVSFVIFLNYPENSHYYVRLQNYCIYFCNIRNSTELSPSQNLSRNS